MKSLNYILVSCFVIALAFSGLGCGTLVPVVKTPVYVVTTNADETLVTSTNLVVNVGATVEANLPLIKTLSYGATWGVFNFAVSPSDRQVKAECAYMIAKNGKLAFQGYLPTPTEFQRILMTFAINDGQQWVNLTTAAQNLYSPVYNNILAGTMSVKVGMETIAAILEGIEQAAKQELPNS